MSDTTVAGMVVMRLTHGSRTSESSVLDASICTKARKVFAPNTIRCSAAYRSSRWSSSSGPCLPQ